VSGARVPRQRGAVVDSRAGPRRAARRDRRLTQVLAAVAGLMQLLTPLPFGA
jgi:hypothetical protein